MARHRSTAYVHSIMERNSITPQFRFIIRLAVACHARGIPYDVEWTNEYFQRMRVSISAVGEIPTAKPLPKSPKLKLVSDWRPTIWDAEYRLDAYYDANLKRRVRVARRKATIRTLASASA